MLKDSFVESVVKVRMENFEMEMDSIILERGRAYFEQGHVEYIKKVDDTHYIVTVVGSDEYCVDIYIDKDGSISSSCDCPYDWGDYCKHEVAAFFAVREHFEEANLLNSASDVQQGLQQQLKKLKKEELIELIVAIAEKAPSAHELINQKTFQPQDEMGLSKKLIEKYINKAKVRGFIEWDRTDEAIYGAEMVLEKAAEQRTKGNTVLAIQLSLEVLKQMVKILQYCDDSSGFVGSVIHQAIDFIQDTVEEKYDEMDEVEQLEAYSIIVKAAHSPIFMGWKEWQLDLLRTCIPFTEYPQMRAELEKELESFIKDKADDYYAEKATALQLEILEWNDEGKQAELFIFKNIQYSLFRKKAIELLLDKQAFQQALQLCEEGERMDAAYPGLIQEWREWKLKAYAGLGETNKQQELMLEFLYNNQFTYYYALKDSFPPEEWDRILTEILKTFEVMDYLPAAYVEILKEEKLLEKMLQYCQSYPQEIQALYPYLKDEFFDETDALYQQYIKAEASQASNRKKYWNVCQLIKTYQNIFGDLYTENLVHELKNNFHKRPAFLDELEKAGY